ncbi:MAG: leucine-rich repeat protein [Ruminococcus sp.]|nr:leucine-rich repeat protein [Ruminococcus sp.]
MKKLNKIMAGIMAVSLCMAGNGVLSENGFISDISIKASAEIIKSGTCGDNATYTLDDEGTLIISGTGEMSYGDFPPWTFTSNSVKNVIIADGITSIGTSAFASKEITSITIPDSVTIIRSWAFWGCTNLTSVTMSNNVTKIDEFAFCSCRNLKEIIIPESVTSIGNAAFDYSGLTKITILNPECAVDNDERSLLNDHQTINDGATIYGYENSTAQAYAKKYKLNFVAIEEPPVIEFESGDINGDNFIDSVDATAVSIEYAHLATGGESTLSDEQKKAADVNGDGFIDAVDSTYILRYYAKISAGQNIDFAEFVKNN